MQKTRKGEEVAGVREEQGGCKSGRVKRLKDCRKGKEAARDQEKQGG